MPQLVMGISTSFNGQEKMVALGIGVLVRVLLVMAILLSFNGRERMDVQRNRYPHFVVSQGSFLVVHSNHVLCFNI